MTKGIKIVIRFQKCISFAGRCQIGGRPAFLFKMMLRTSISFMLFLCLQSFSRCFSVFNFFQVFRWQHAVFFFEASAEIGDAVDADHESDFRDGVSPFEQQLFGILHFVSCNTVARYLIN
jgi:hypothetical protein